MLIRCIFWRHAPGSTRSAPFVDIPLLSQLEGFSALYIFSGVLFCACLLAAGIPAPFGLFAYIFIVARSSVTTHLRVCVCLPGCTPDILALVPLCTASLPGALVSSLGLGCLPGWFLLFAMCDLHSSLWRSVLSSLRVFSPLLSAHTLGLGVASPFYTGGFQ
jgi:hypothetical protein